MIEKATEKATEETTRRLTWLAFALALLLFGTSLTHFHPRVVDLGARRVLGGDVPYRDFWTMYAPGSFYVLAGAFAVCGVQSVVANALGIVTAAAGVAVFHRLCARVASERVALCAAALFAASYYGTGYHNGFASYPPAILLILLGAHRLAGFVAGEGRRRLLEAGLSFGGSALFKHDLGAYTCIAAAATLVIAGVPPGERRVASIARLAAFVLASLLPPLALLAWKAGPEMLEDLVVFPLGDFAMSREESFPGILDPLGDAEGLHAVRRGCLWLRLWLPMGLALAALPILWRRRRSLAPEQRHVIVFAYGAFALFWQAAHVQVNTHQITLTALGALLAGAAFLGRTRGRRAVIAAAVVCLLWSPTLVVEGARRQWQRVRRGTEPAGLPHMAGIRVKRGGARGIREFHDALRAAGPSDAPLLLLANRNDIVIAAALTPYFLSEREFATAHHELHPAVTDTAAVQRRMLAQIRAGPLPVLLREHRFHPPESLDAIKRRFIEVHGLPVGATLLDDWIRANYLPAEERFGMYEILRPRSR